MLHDFFVPFVPSVHLFSVLMKHTDVARLKMPASYLNINFHFIFINFNHKEINNEDESALKEKPSGDKARLSAASARF